jgi:hypothetical protein
MTFRVKINLQAVLSTDINMFSTSGTFELTEDIKNVQLSTDVLSISGASELQGDIRNVQLRVKWT